MYMDKGQYVFPLWLRSTLSVFCLIFIVVYWNKRGPDNFLWFTDIAFFLIVIASWLSSPFLIGMAAVSAFLFEIVWNLDFFSKFIFDYHLFDVGATAYMFDVETPLIIKVLSFILHVSLPVLMVYMLKKLGFHRHAWKAQVLVLSLVLPFCFLFTDPQRNINWVFGFNSIQTDMPGWIYLLLQIVLIPIVVYLPTHMFLSRMFERPR